MKDFSKPIVTKKALAIFTAICMMFACIGTLSTTAFAATDNSKTTGTKALTNTVFYPISGQTSGVFYGIQSQTAQFYLPAGTIQISYSYESPTSSDYIAFSGPDYETAYLTVHNGNQANTTVTLDEAGIYTVYIGSTTVLTQKIFGYSLYTN